MKEQVFIAPVPSTAHKIVKPSDEATIADNELLKKNF